MADERDKGGLRFWGSVASGGLGALLLATQLIDATQKFTTSIGGVSPGTLVGVGVVLLLAAVTSFAAAASDRSTLLRPDTFAFAVDMTTAGNLRGRDADVRDLIEISERTPELFLYGDSGVGKTGLLRAGLWRALRSSRTVFPLYMSGLNDDLGLGGFSPLMARLWDELTDEQRKIMGLFKAPSAADAPSVLRQIEGSTGRKPLLILDQFDDFLSRNSARLMVNERSWISTDALAQQSPFWEAIRRLVQDGSIHLLAASTSDFAVGFRLITFVQSSETYHLRRVDTGSMRSLMLDLSDRDGPLNAVSRPEHGWKQLQDRILRDIAVDGGVLPAQLRVLLGGLGSLRALTIDEYLRAGGAEGLESLYVSRYAGDCASACNVTKRVVIAALSGLVNPDEMKTYSRTSEQLVEALREQVWISERDGAEVSMPNVDAWMSFMSGRNQLVRARESLDGRAKTYSLRHDYLCRGILRLQRDSGQHRDLLAEQYRLYRERGSGALAWWRSLIPFRLLVRLFLARVRGELRFDQSRRFVLASLARTVPAIGMGALYIALADAGVLLPGQTVIQRRLDRGGLSVFRRPKPLNVIKATASEYRKSLLRMLGARLWDGWVVASVVKARDVDTWAQAQAAAAIARAPESDKIANISAPRILHRLFQSGTGLSKYGWPEDILATRVEYYPSPAVFYMTAAQSAALLRNPGPAGGVNGDGLRADLRTLIRMQEFYRAANGRGWTFAAASDPPEASVFSTSLGTNALMSLRAIGDTELSTSDIERDIQAGVEWLFSRFETDGNVAGWRETPGDAISDGLTFQVFGTLLRSLTTETTAPSPVRNLVKKYVPGMLGATGAWQVNHPDDLSYFYGHVLLPGSARTEYFRPTNLLWYPSAIECAVAWLRWAGKNGEETESTLRVLTHLVVELKDDMLRRLSGSYTYMISETLYALSALDEIKHF